jgi:cell division control protein 6
MRFYNQNGVSMIFKNKGVLKVDSVDVPIGREEQKQEICRCLEDITGGIKTNLAVIGPTGTCKTMLIKSMTSSVNFKVAYVSCSEISPISRFQAAAHIAKELGGDFGKGSTTGECLDYIKERAVKNPILIVIDEVDKLVKKDDSLLLSILEMANVSLFLISNDITWQDNLDSRILSRFKDKRLTFDAYNQNQLLGILDDKARKALHDSVVDTVILEKIAREIAFEVGDARKAITWLWAAAENADKEGKDKITLEDVDNSKSKMETENLYNMIKKFPMQDQLLLAAYVDSSTVIKPPSEIFPIRERRKNILVNAPRRTTQEIHYWFNKKLHKKSIRTVGEERTRQRLRHLEMMGLLRSNKTGLGQGKGKETIWYSNFSDKEWFDALLKLGVPLEGTGMGSLDSGLGPQF